MKLITKITTSMILSIFLSVFMLSHSFAQETKEASKQTEPVKETKEEFIKSLKKYQIAYLSKGDIWIMRGDGSDKKKITQSGDITILFGWSYDDTKLLFGTGKLDLDPVGNYTSGYKLHTADIEKNEIKRIVKDKEVIYFAEWSPTQDKIAFLDKKENLWIMNGDESELKKLNNGIVSQPTWSPDGTKVAYVVTPPLSGDVDPDEPLKSSHVWVIDTRLDSKVRVTDVGITKQPMWLTDTKIIIFKVTGKYGMGESLIYDWETKKNIKTGIKAVEAKTEADKENFKKSEIISAPLSIVEKLYQSQKIYFIRIATIREYSNIDWAPDSKAIIFVSSKGELFVGDSNGENLAKIADKGDYPFWSNKEAGQ